MSKENIRIEGIIDYQVTKIKIASESKYPPKWIESLPLLEIDDEMQVVSLSWNGKSRNIIDDYTEANDLELSHKREIMAAIDDVSYPMIDGKFPLRPLSRYTLVGTVSRLSDKELDMIGLNTAGIRILRKLFGKNTESSD